MLEQNGTALNEPVVDAINEEIHHLYEIHNSLEKVLNFIS